MYVEYIYIYFVGQGPIAIAMKCRGKIGHVMRKRSCDQCEVQQQDRCIVGAAQTRLYVCPLVTYARTTHTGGILCCGLQHGKVYSMSEYSMVRFRPM